MARIRSIKPEFWSSEQVMACSRDARLLFIGIWNFVDDEGRCPYSPKTLKAQIVPCDDDASSEKVQRWIDELSSNDLLLIYDADGKQFLQVTGWHHQKIDRPRASKHPRPPIDTSTNNRRALAPDLILSDLNGREREGAPRAPSSILLPEDWRPSPAAIERAKALGLTGADIDKMLLRFGPHYRARGEKRADWDEQFLAWCADEVKKLDRSPPRPPKPPAPAAPVDPLWAPIKDQLLAMVGEDVFANWFSGAVVVSIEDEELVLGGPTKFVIAHWTSSLFEKIGAAVTAAYPNITSFKFVVAAQPGRKTA